MTAWAIFTAAVYTLTHGTLAHAAGWRLTIRLHIRLDCTERNQP